jgi:hypothetical protein
MMEICSYICGNVVSLSFWLVQDPSYEQMTRTNNGKKDSERVGMTTYCFDTLFEISSRTQIGLMNGFIDTFDAFGYRRMGIVECGIQWVRVEV